MTTDPLDAVAVAEHDATMANIRAINEARAARKARRAARVVVPIGEYRPPTLRSTLANITAIRGGRHG